MLLQEFLELTAATEVVILLLKLTLKNMKLSYHYFQKGFDFSLTEVEWTIIFSCYMTIDNVGLTNIR